MYDHYIGLDWAQRNMAIARMTKHANKIVSIDVKSDVGDLKVYLKQLNGKKIITFEESCPAQWLYTELRSCVDEIVVCDPYRNHLLKEGVKTDIADGVPRRPPFPWMKVPPWQLPVQPSSEECIYGG